MSHLELPFDGVPGAWGVVFWIAFVVVVVMFGWNALLLLRAERWGSASHGAEEAEESAAVDGEVRSALTPEDLLWVFLVPAKDEERTIADSVGRLAQVDVGVANRIVLVIDDGSTDATAARLAELDDPHLEVLTRVAPDAATGKAAALDAAYRRLVEIVDERGIAHDRVIVGVVDADGRLDPAAPAHVGPHFTSDPRLGGVQVLVRIYNRDRVLTRCQDIEFGLAGSLYQSARSTWGTAGMGGNGQFNRLSALDSVADERGPWRDTLTEDLDLGLRLLGAGWRLVHDNDTHVAQQGVPGLLVLYRQRTRWSQGTLQAMALLLPTARRMRTTTGARLDLVLNLLMPVWQVVVGTAFIGAVYLLLTGQVQLFGGSWLQLLFFYLLGFSATLLGCIERGRRRAGARGALLGALIAHPYAIYTWLLWPVLLRAGTRQLLRRHGWAKTARVEIDAPEADPESAN